MALQDRISNARKVFGDSRARVIFVIVIVLIVLTVLIAYFKLKRAAPPAEATAAVKSVPGISSIPGVGTPPREYVKLQEQQNIQQAQEAARKGTAAIPTLIRSTYLESGAATELTKQGGAASVAGCGVEDLKRARAAGVAASELRCRGCSSAALRAAGYSAGDLKDAGFSANELKDAGYNAGDLKDAGYSSKDLKAAGFAAQDLAAAGFSAGDLKNAGYSDQELRGAGYTDTSLLAAGVGTVAGSETGDCSIEKLRAARNSGATAADIKSRGCSAAAMRAAGYTAAELRAAGFSAKDLKDAGFSAKDLRDAGFSAKELHDAGFNANDLRAAGFSAKDLKDVGFSAGELRAAGYTADALKAADFSTKDLKNAGYTADDLNKAGFSAAELKGAGYSDGDLVRAGIATAGSAAIAPLPTQVPVNPPPVEQAPAPKAEKKQTPAEAAIAAAGQPSAIQKQLDDARRAEMEKISAAEYQDKLRQTSQVLAAQANELFAAWTPVPSQQFVQGAPPPPAGQGQAGGAGAGAAGPNALANVNVYKAGTISFAILDTGINSDENSPVLASIIQGPLTGGKLLGRFERADKKVILQFTVLNLPKLPTSIAINAVAIDPNTARTAIAQSVDNHYMLRFGTVFAASFISGLGQAFQNAGSTIVTTATTGSTVTLPDLNTAQKALVALGNVGQQFSTIVQPLTQKPPTVKVNAGSSIGILLMQDLQVPKT